MTSSWVIREKILDVTHKWPLILVFCTVGMFIGLGISFFWPSSYRSSKELYVGIDPYRALSDRNASEHAGLVFTNPDDYKNWQMANLNAFVHTDAVIKATLERLQREDDYWLNVDRETLAGMLRANWRNAGKWRLVVEGEDPTQAAQAVTAWYEVVLEQVRTAILKSQETYTLDTQLQSVTFNQTQLALQLDELTQIHANIKDEITSLNEQPANYNIDQKKYLGLLQLVARANQVGTERKILEALPPQGSDVQTYLDWIQQMETSLNHEIQVKENQISTLEKRRETIAAQYAQASNRSYGLSANLQVEGLRAAPTEHYAVRPTGMLVLVGGIVGFLAWAMLWLVRATMKGSA